MGGKIKLSISPCPNDTFMFDALINGRIDTSPYTFEVKYYDIEELNSRAINEQGADISKISCAVLPLIEHHYRLLESGAALGSGNGPLLVRRKGDHSPLKHIAIPGVHTTAAALVKRLCPEIEECTPLLFSQIAEAVERGEFDGGVLIHEGRFTYAERNLCLVADLGDLWESKLSLPLPLGAIVASKSLSDKTVEDINHLLRQSIEYAFANPQASREFIKEHAQELHDEVIDSHIALFVNDFSLELGQIGHQAIKALTCEQR